MQILFEHWKYIFRNLWFVLPFAVTPALFLTLSVDFSAVEVVTRSFFAGGLELSFPDLFRAWSFFRIDSVLGVLYSVFALVSLVVFSAFLLAFVEKHMRIGKRTLSGVFSQLGSHLFSIIGVTFLFLALYEIWAVVLSAALFAVCAVPAKGFARFLFVFVCLVFMAALLYLITIFYLLLPCMQITGFRAYEAFLYSYRLAVGVRWRIIFSLAISYLPGFFVVVACSVFPDLLGGAITFVLFTFLYMSFCIRMETVYFRMDKLDREDLLRSYKEL